MRVIQEILIEDKIYQRQWDEEDKNTYSTEKEAIEAWYVYTRDHILAPYTETNE